MSHWAQINYQQTTSKGTRLAPFETRPPFNILKYSPHFLFPDLVGDPVGPRFSQSSSVLPQYSVVFLRFTFGNLFGTTWANKNSIKFYRFQL